MAPKKIQRGSVILHNRESALLALEKALQNKLPIVGIDAFAVIGDAIRPELKRSIDLSPIESASESARRAIIHIEKAKYVDWFEIVYG